MATQMATVFGPSGLPHGFKRPAMAIELAESREDVATILRCGKDWPEALCTRRTNEMKQQQSYDRIFIFLYAFYFIYLACLGLSHGSRLIRITSLLLIFSVLAAAIFDWLEDDRIVDALTSSGAPQVRFYAVTKWALLSIAILLASPIFLGWRTPALPMKLARGFMLLCAVLALWKAVWGMSLASDSDLGTAAWCIAAFTALSIVFLAGEPLWRDGTQKALDRIAALPVLRQLANWPQDE